ncbi:hypothetical protein LBMAG53_02820 [Planctomycetota bacterium]|nr:hypothetical protein LBMAG53_02820 [Planctomycetota bacterium]
MNRTYDSSAPAVVLAAATGPFNTSFTVSITFSEPVNGFTASDLVVTNGSASGLVGTGAGPYQTFITPASDGEVRIDVPANAATDLAGNLNTAANQLVRTYKAASVESSKTACALGSGLSVVLIGILLMLRSRSSIHGTS